MQPKSHVWMKLSSKEKLTDVSVGPNGEVFVIDTDGNIRQVVNDKISADTFNNKEAAYGDKCRIAVNLERELIVYVVDKDRQVYKVTRGATTQSRLYPTVMAEDVSVDAAFNLYLTTRNGIYKKAANSENLNGMTNNSIGSHIAVGKKIWVLGYDKFPYSADKF